MAACLQIAFLFILLYAHASPQLDIQRGTSNLIAGPNSCGNQAAPNYMSGFPLRPLLIPAKTKYKTQVERPPQYPILRDNFTEDQYQTLSCLITTSDRMGKKIQTAKDLNYENLADSENLFIARWCLHGVVHKVCGNDVSGESKIYRLQSFKMMDEPRDTFDPSKGAVGLMLLTKKGDYLRLYFNPTSASNKWNMGRITYADGNTGVIYKDGNGLNSIQNFQAYFRSEEKSNPDPANLQITVGGMNDHRGWWEHNTIALQNKNLVISQTEDQFEEKWQEVNTDELSPVERRTISRDGPGMKILRSKNNYECP